MKKEKLSLFLFIDAFGWEIRQRHPGFLKGLIVEEKPLETILGYSSACDPSIISGLTPAEHGLWSSYYYDPGHSPFKWTKPLSLLPESIFNQGRVRGRMSKWVAKKSGITGYFQLYAVPFKHLHLFNYAERKRIWEPGGLPFGESIFDRMQREGIPYHTHQSGRSDEQRIGDLLADIEQQKIEFAYCSFGKLDGLMHAEGTHSPNIASLIEWYDQQVRSIIKTAEENYKEVAWYAFTDHGMHDVVEVCGLMTDIEQLGLRWNSDYVAFYDATMARFWFMNDAARDAVTDLLANHPKGRVLSDDELKQHGVYFEDGKYGELVFLMNSGIQIVPSFMGLKSCKGMHGYNPADAESKATLLSNHPIPDSVTRIQHIHSIMLNEQGLDQWKS